MSDNFQGVTIYTGAPGTGKTQALLNAAQDFLTAGHDPSCMLVLTPSRVSATRFRENLTAAAQQTMSVAPMRAWQAYAFDVLRRAHVAGLLPGLDFAPKLLSGPEQDVVLAELLAGHSEGVGAAIRWPADLHEAIGTQGFRHELRDFFDRMAEYNLTSAQVRELGQQLNRPEWVAAADLYTEYRQIRRLRMPNAYDPAALINEAADVLLNHPDYLAEERNRLDLVLIDDLQEATPSIFRLLRVLCGEASSPAPAPATQLTICTDTVVQGFRGARPDLARTLPEIFPDHRRVDLSLSHRMPAPIATAWEAVATRIPPVAGVHHSRDLSQPVSTEPTEQALWELGDDNSLLDPIKSQDLSATVQGHTVDSPQSEARLLAQMILEDHLYRGRSYARSVIIVRSGSSVNSIQRVLEGQGIPVRTARALRPVREEPAVRPFLDALALVIYGHGQTAGGAVPEISVDVAEALLTSRLGGATAMDIRRLRQSLRAQELRAGGTRASDELLVEALLNPDFLPSSRVAASARRIGQVLTAGSEALNVAGATAETVLWALWEASGLAAPWRETALSHSPAAERAHRDLDAMMGLFEAATRYVDQMPGATAAQFLEYIDAQDLPMDTLTERTDATEAVEILTPAQAAGREWDIVYVAGLQDGVWPNTTIRGSLLNTKALTDIFDLGPEAAATVGTLDRLKETRYDEFRMFSTAISRAKYRLVCTAVKNVDTAPSELLDIAAPAEQGVRENTIVRRPMTLRAMIAELRQFSERAATDPVRAQAAARILNRFTDTDRTAGMLIPGAHPSQWWGLLELSSQGPTFDPQTPVPISPSRVEAIHSSPLDWFVSQSKAEAATDLARSIGTLVHEIAEDLPDWAADTVDDGETFTSQLLNELKTRFERLGLPNTWETQLVYQRAEEMLLKFSAYVADMHTGGTRELVGVEGSFSVLIPARAEAAEPRAALLSGRVDRLEKTVGDDGKYVIADLKTGRTPPPQRDIEQHPQLAAYQVALEAGAGHAMAARVQDFRDAGGKETLQFEGLHEASGGAHLVQIGKQTKSYGEQAQPPLSHDAAWAVELINRAAELISVAHLQARHDSSREGAFGKSCRLPDICPLCARGRQITHP